MAIIDAWDYWDYPGVGASRLTNYAAGDGQPQEIIRGLLAPLRDLENIHHQMFEGLSFSRATGAMLDAFGAMVQLPRVGRTDAAYREAIRRKRFSSGGSGTWPEIKQLIKSNFGGSNRKVDHYPAAYVAVITDTPNITSDIKKQLQDSSVAGVAPYPVFDYGLGGFVLSGIIGSTDNVLGVAPGTDVILGAKPGTDVAIGAGGRSILALGGTPLGSVRERDSTTVDLGSAAAGAYYFGTY